MLKEMWVLTYILYSNNLKQKYYLSASMSGAYR